MAFFGKNPKISTSKKKNDIVKGLWQKCPSCRGMLHELELAATLNVCPKCQHHLQLPAPLRIDATFDADTFQEFDAELTSLDPLKFTGPTAYADRLKHYKDATGLNEAVLTGFGTLHGYPIALGVMDFRFLGASMGSIVGEKLARLIERATEVKRPIVIFTASGGARLHEGMFGLMQMVKVSGALARHAQANLLFISVLTDPTMGGVMASIASLGDLIIAEPGCRIAITGPNNAKEVTMQDPPRGFGKVEYFQEHGFVDLIVHRRDLRDRLGKSVQHLCAKQ
ncbi:MAG: acetyl-CoA carboxylase, carboxyltransferase subunit beta [Verrucomicrobia bacterium]|nr:acetyl-CoA carboxylase, carboxyltransferase subunit beta [Verrucomicrobiota bacterium]